LEKCKKNKTNKKMVQMKSLIRDKNLKKKILKRAWSNKLE